MVATAGDLTGQRIVVIGGSRGIGYEIAAMSLERGAEEVVIASRSREAIEQAATQIEERTGRRPRTEAIDITNRAGVAAFLQATAPIDHLHLPGSVVTSGPYASTVEEAARASFDSKFWGPFWAVFDARPLMRQGGSITMYSGIAARRPVKGFVMGAAIDGAIDAAVRSLALELREIGVRINSIAPGVIHTPLWDEPGPDVRDRAFAFYRERLPVARVGTAKDVSQAALYLMTCGFVSGQVLSVDGGMESME